MAETIIKNQRVIFGGLALESQANAVSLAVSADVQDRTDLASDFKKRAAGGIKDAALAVSGFYDAGPVDEALFNAIGAAGKTVIVTQPQKAEGVVAYFLQALAGQYTPFGNAAGELASFDLAAASSGVLVRGKIAADRTITESVAVAYQTLQAVANGRSLYAAVAILSLSDGAEVTVDIEHSDGGGGETQAISFAALDGGGAWFGSSSDATAQTQFRANITLTGTDPEAEIIVAIGVQ